MGETRSSKKKSILFIIFFGVILGIGLSFGMDYLTSQPDASQASLATDEQPTLNMFEDALKKLHTRFDVPVDEPVILIRLSTQELFLMNNDEILKTYTISGSLYGAGSKAGSNQTPLGTHKISSKIGAGAPLGTIFKARVNTGKIATIYTDGTDVEDDLVTTRIMWLRGQEQGVNKGAGVDSHARYIYIHGTQEEGLIGKPASHGCIRMKNTEVVELFDLVREGTFVEILD